MTGYEKPPGTDARPFTDDELALLSETDKNQPPAADAGDTVSVPSAQDVDESRLSAWCVFDLVAGSYVDATFRTRPPTEKMMQEYAEATDSTGANRFEWHRV